MTPEELFKLKRFMRKFECAAHRIKLKGLPISGSIWTYHVVNGKYRTRRSDQSNYGGIHPLTLVMEGRQHGNGMYSDLDSYFQFPLGAMDISFGCGFISVHEHLAGNRAYFQFKSNYEVCLYELGLHYAKQHLGSVITPELPSQLL